MTNEEKELAEFIFNSSGISLSISIPDLEKLAKALIQRYPQITKKPLTLFLREEDKFNYYLSLGEDFEYGLDKEEVKSFKSIHYVEVVE